MSWHIHLAVFVPFLEVEKFATIDGLPERLHECNYRGARALLFQRLPYLLTISRMRTRGLGININADTSK